MCVSPKCQLCHGDWFVFHPSVSCVIVIDVCFTQMSAMSWRLMCVSLLGQLCHGDCFHSSNVSYAMVIMCVSLQRQLCHGDWCVFRSNDWWLCLVYSNVSDAIGDCGWFTPMLAVLMVNCVWFTPMLAMPWWLIVFGLLQCQLCHSWLWLVYSSAISAMMAVLLQC